MPVERGEVYLVDLNPTKGREQSGRRPVVVVSNDELNRRPLVALVAPGTRGIKVPADYPGNIRFAAGTAGLPEETVFMAFQVRALDHTRFQGRPVGRLTGAEMLKLDEALAWCLSLTLKTGSS